MFEYLAIGCKVMVVRAFSRAGSCFLALRAVIRGDGRERLLKDFRRM